MNDMVCLRLSLSSGERGPICWPHNVYAFDDFAMFGSLEADGTAPERLDACGGHIGIIDGVRNLSLPRLRGVPEPARLHCGRGGAGQFRDDRRDGHRCRQPTRWRYATEFR